MNTSQVNRSMNFQSQYTPVGRSEKNIESILGNLILVTTHPQGKPLSWFLTTWISFAHLKILYKWTHAVQGLLWLLLFSIMFVRLTYIFICGCNSFFFPLAGLRFELRTLCMIGESCCQPFFQSFVCVCVCGGGGTGVWTQGLTLAR
jgi:hypothetical protein